MISKLKFMERNFLNELKLGKILIFHYAMSYGKVKRKNLI